MHPKSSPIQLLLLLMLTITTTCTRTLNNRVPVNVNHAAAFIIRFSNTAIDADLLLYIDRIAIAAIATTGVFATYIRDKESEEAIAAIAVNTWATTRRTIWSSGGHGIALICTYNNDLYSIPIVLHLAWRSDVRTDIYDDGMAIHDCGNGVCPLNVISDMPVATGEYDGYTPSGLSDIDIVRKTYFVVKVGTFLSSVEIAELSMIYPSYNPLISAKRSELLQEVGKVMHSQHVRVVEYTIVNNTWTLHPFRTEYILLIATSYVSSATIYKVAANGSGFMLWQTFAGLRTCGANECLPFANIPGFADTSANIVPQNVILDGVIIWLLPGKQATFLQAGYGLGNLAEQELEVEHALDVSNAWLLQTAIETLRIIDPTTSAIEIERRGAGVSYVRWISSTFTATISKWYSVNAASILLLMCEGWRVCGWPSICSETEKNCACRGRNIITDAVSKVSLAYPECTIIGNSNRGIRQVINNIHRSSFWLEEHGYTVIDSSYINSWAAFTRRLSKKAVISWNRPVESQIIFTEESCSTTIEWAAWGYTRPDVFDYEIQAVLNFGAIGEVSLQNSNVYGKFVPLLGNAGYIRTCDQTYASIPTWDYTTAATNARAGTLQQFNTSDMRSVVYNGVSEDYCACRNEYDELVVATDMTAGAACYRCYGGYALNTASGLCEQTAQDVLIVLGCVTDGTVGVQNGSCVCRPEYAGLRCAKCAGGNVRRGLSCAAVKLVCGNGTRSLDGESCIAAAVSTSCEHGWTKPWMNNGDTRACVCAAGYISNDAMTSCTRMNCPAYADPVLVTMFGVCVAKAGHILGSDSCDEGYIHDGGRQCVNIIEILGPNFVCDTGSSESCHCSNGWTEDSLCTECAPGFGGNQCTACTVPCIFGACGGDNFCICNDGAIGPTCNMCLDGYVETSNGCVACELCARGGLCGTYGKCVCPSGWDTATQCEFCLPTHYQNESECIKAKVTCNGLGYAISDTECECATGTAKSPLTTSVVCIACPVCPASTQCLLSDELLPICECLPGYERATNKNSTTDACFWITPEMPSTLNISLSTVSVVDIPYINSGEIYLVVLYGAAVMFLIFAYLVRV